jgi:hypothetical protein
VDLEELSGAADPEAFIATAADRPRTRRLLAGSLTIAADALYSDKRARFERGLRPRGIRFRP